MTSQQRRVVHVKRNWPRTQGYTAEPHSIGCK